jgi:hypothetical protein
MRQIRMQSVPRESLGDANVRFNLLGAPRPQRDRRGLVKRLLQAEHL